MKSYLCLNFKDVDAVFSFSLNVKYVKPWVYPGCQDGSFVWQSRQLKNLLAC